MYNDILEMLELLLDSSAMSCTRNSDDSVKWDVDGLGTITLKIEKVDWEN